jgi:hypothetical protein
LRLRNDASALESIPLKLVIVAAVAGLSIIPAADALESMRNKDFVGRAQLQIEQIAHAVQVVAMEGPGSVRTLSLDFSSEGSVGFFRLSLGDSEGGAAMNCVALKLNTGAYLTSMVDDPPAWLRGYAGDGLDVFNPVFDLRIENRLDGESGYILVEEGQWTS